MEEAKPKRRRRHDRELKQRVLVACSEPGASVASIALAHGLNANLVHKWRRQAGTVGPVEAFVPVAVTSAGPVHREPAQAIHVELQRGPFSVRVNWPLSAAETCAAWLRELLR
ncbi:IS66-like element accessory protein TnpA [Caldimonas brevitalea]|uniref:Transposase n=1 Tax=Caldimonas brevitalea TaxID=413882 RepID=A0A0G3BKH7_9BURK|nr:transposase [Caldimonas brevitalea]AKJ27050.1 transposase [Caldimonas brevitalea]